MIPQHSLISASTAASAGLKEKLIVSGTERNGSDFAHLIEVGAGGTGETPTVWRPAELLP